jgi:uncharacterized membrane protein YhiD involved in acid resistance
LKNLVTGLSTDISAAGINIKEGLTLIVYSIVFAMIIWAIVSIFKHMTRAGSMHRTSKKEFSNRYLFEGQGTSESSECFQIDLK